MMASTSSVEGDRVGAHGYEREEDSDTERSCPICFYSQADLVNNVHLTWVVNPGCGHIFCRSCLDRLLLASAATRIRTNNNSNISSIADNTSFTTTTLGSCPICRVELSYFDLRFVDTNELLVDRSVPWDPQLCGAVFVESQGVGWGSLHFPSVAVTRAGDAQAALTANTPDEKCCEATSPTNQQLNGPYINLSNVPPSSDSPVANINFLPSSSRYHAPSHTWEGHAQRLTTISDDVVAKLKWRVVLTFSDNFSRITRGVMIQYTTIVPPPPKTEESDNDQQAKPRDTFRVLDGQWQVVPTVTGTDTAMTVHIAQGLIRYNACWHKLSLQQLQQNAPPLADLGHFQMVPAASSTSPSKATYAASWDWTSHPDGPVTVGSRLEWRSMQAVEADESLSSRDDGRVVMHWVRQSEPPPPSSFHQESTVSIRVTPIGGDLGRKFRRIDIASSGGNEEAPSRRPSYHQDTVWGNVFCQALTVGLASYHFVSPPTNSGTASSQTTTSTSREPEMHEGFVYISYEHAQVAEWPLLDDGRPIPSRVQFRNISFPDAHTFRGHICWLEEYGTTWQGMVRWEYEMKFDGQFMCILSGTVHSIRSDTDEVRIMSRFGVNLVYCNAALYENFANQVASCRNRANGANATAGGEVMENNGTSLFAPLQRRLLESLNGATHQTWTMIVGLAMDAISNVQASETDNVANPMDYNL